jgi:hypothetical protein
LIILEGVNLSPKHKENSCQTPCQPLPLAFPQVLCTKNSPYSL